MTGCWTSERQIQTFTVFNDNGHKELEYVLGTDIHAGSPEVLRRVAGIIQENDIKEVTTNFPPIAALWKSVIKILEKEYEITDVILDVPDYSKHEHVHDDEVNENDVV